MHDDYLQKLLSRCALSGIVVECKKRIDEEVIDT